MGKVSERARRHGKWRFVCVLAVLIAPLLFTGYAYSNHSKLKVGIVLVDDCERRFAELAKEAIEHYGEYFTATILDVRLNASRVRVKDGNYLTDDFNDPAYTEVVREQYGVDVVLMITDHPVRNWLGDNRAIWGEADIRSASAVVSVRGYETNSTAHKEHVRQVALHELAHTVGFRHCYHDKSCVMRYGEGSAKFCSLHAIELPYRLTLAPLTLGWEGTLALTLLSLALALLLAPYLFVFFAWLHEFFVRRFYKKIRPSRLTLPIECFLGYLLLAASPTLLLAPALAVFVCVMLELLFFFALQVENAYRYKKRRR
jgi:predicted Zn-dependent protease